MLSERQPQCTVNITKLSRASHHTLNIVAGRHCPSSPHVPPSLGQTSGAVHWTPTVLSDLQQVLALMQMPSQSIWPEGQAAQKQARGGQCVHQRDVPEPSEGTTMPPHMPPVCVAQPMEPGAAHNGGVDPAHRRQLRPPRKSRVQCTKGLHLHLSCSTESGG